MDEHNMLKWTAVMQPVCIEFFFARVIRLCQCSILYQARVWWRMSTFSLCPNQLIGACQILFSPDRVAFDCYFLWHMSMNALFLSQKCCTELVIYVYQYFCTVRRRVVSHSIVHSVTHTMIFLFEVRNVVPNSWYMFTNSFVFVF